ncbi:IclR family transcriptional regulator [Rhodococcus sp. NPDC055024]
MASTRDTTVSVHTTELSESVAGQTNSVNRAMALLHSFRPDARELTLTQLAERTGLSKATALRLLKTMRSGGLIGREGRVYRLGDGLVSLGLIAARSRIASPCDDLREAAMPFLQDLYLRHPEMTVHLAAMDGTDVVYVEKLYGHSRVNSPARIGARIPATNTAVGKAMLSQGEFGVVEDAIRNLRPMTQYSLCTAGDVIDSLRRIREDGGLAFDFQEAQEGLVCAAVPVLHRGVCVAAVSVAGSASGFDPLRIHIRVRRAAVNIGRSLDALSTHAGRTGGVDDASAHPGMGVGSVVSLDHSGNEFAVRFQ